MSVELRPTVVIADDDPAVCAALAELIVAHPGLTLVGVADSGASATAMCRHHRPTAALIDPIAVGGRDAIVAVQDAAPATSIVVYTARADRRGPTRMEALAADVVLVEGSIPDLVEELGRVARARIAVAGSAAEA